MQSKFRLLIVRLGAMGDILHALPAVTALRKAHPGWIIDWVVEPRWHSLLGAPGSTVRDTASPHPRQPLVDHIHLAATKDWRRNLLASHTRDLIAALRHSLRDAQYDVVLDLQGAIRSAMIGRMTGCHRFIGEAKPRERAARVFFTERVITHGAHVIEQDVELAEAIAGDQLKPEPPMLPVDLTSEAWADALLAPFAGRPAVLINPGAGWGAKRWPVDRYAEVAKSLIARGCTILVNAGPGEQHLADVIVKRTAGAAIPLVVNIDQLIAITRRISLAIAGDTGPLHLACALCRPVLGIYGPTDPSRNGPFGTRFKVLRSPESRRDHTRYQTPEAGLLTIQPPQVLQAAEELLYSESTP